MAAEPVQLTDQALDTVTAGALIGIRIDALALSGPNQSAIARGRSFGFDSGPLFAAASAESSGAGIPVASAAGNDNAFASGSGNPSDVGTADVVIDGNVLASNGPLFASTIGIFQAQVASTGSGQASATIQPVILSGTPVINETLVVPFGDGAMIGVLLAATD